MIHVQFCRFRFLLPVSAVLLMLLKSAASYGISRTERYVVLSDTREILGQLQVNSVESDTVTTVSVNSQFTIQILVNIDIRYTLKSVFHNKHLFSNSIVTYRDNSINSVVQTLRSGAIYHYQKDNEERTLAQKITFAESLLYFNEPVQKTSVYSEFDGIDKPITTVKTGHFQIKNPENGHVSDYFYEDGVLQRAIVQVSFVPICIERIKQD